MVRYATAVRLGTAETEAISRPFTRNNLQHPTYNALGELGYALQDDLPVPLFAIGSRAPRDARGAQVLDFTAGEMRFIGGKPPGLAGFAGWTRVCFNH
jgi:hypothetical protein